MNIIGWEIAVKKMFRMRNFPESRQVCSVELVSLQKVQIVKIIYFF